jgi:hypothetical protein
MKITIGNFLDKGLDNGTIKPNQIVVYYDHNNNIKWLGKAEKLRYTLTLYSEEDFI